MTTSSSTPQNLERGKNAETRSGVRRLRQVVKRWVTRGRTWVVRRFFPFTRDDLAAALRRCGLDRGDMVLVHSSWDRFEGFRGSPTDIIGALQSIVGDAGTVLMPTQPFTGTAVGHARANPILDLRRTPSRMGLVSELFRRMPGTVRSVHPTHPVAAAGKDAESVCAHHRHASTPCGEHSPYAELSRRNGKILLLGTGIDVLTFYHYIEELLESELPTSPFTAETFALQTRLPDGTLVATSTRLFEPAVSRRRVLSRLIPVLKQQNAWRTTHVGRLDVVLLDCRDVITAVRNLANKGIYCYE